MQKVLSSFLNPEPLSLCKFLSRPWTLYICLKWGTMWDGFFHSNGANQRNLLNISIIERTDTTRISLKFTKSIWCCVWISLTCIGRGIALFLNLTLNGLNYVLLAVLFNISLSLKPTTLSAVLNRSLFAPPLLAPVKAFSNIFFHSPIFETVVLTWNSSELSLPLKKKFIKVSFLVYTKEVQISLGY